MDSQAATAEPKNELPGAAASSRRRRAVRTSKRVMDRLAPLHRTTRATARLVRTTRRLAADGALARLLHAAHGFAHGSRRTRRLALAAAMRFARRLTLLHSHGDSLPEVANVAQSPRKKLIIPFSRKCCASTA